MKSFTSLIFASLLCCLLETLQPSEATWQPDLDDGDSEGVLKRWAEDSPEEDAEVERILHYYTVVRDMHGTNPGRYQCVRGMEYLLMSDGYPSLYPKMSKKKWIFKTDSETEARLYCPVIRIHPSRRCKNDKLSVFGGPKFTRGRRRCGRINDYRQTFDQDLKVTFKSNRDERTSKGFICTVRCIGPPTTTTTTTTTTFSPLCPQPAFPPSVPTPVASCADIPPEFSSVCNCTDCMDGRVSLTCDFCTRCDFDIFALMDFSVGVILEPHFPCPHSLDATGYFFHNADYIESLRICLEEDMSNVIFPYAELANLETLAYQNCNGSLIDLCSTTRTVAVTHEKEQRAVVPSTRSACQVTLPDPADIMNVVNLYLHDVCMTIDNVTLSCPRLEFISIDSDHGDVDIEANAFGHLVAIRTLIVRICQDTLKSESFKLNAVALESLTIDDTCIHTFMVDSIQLDGVQGRHMRTSHNTITVSITASAALVPFIPQCPFRQLLEMDLVYLIWTTVVQCRDCGGYWYWSLTPSEIANISSTCYDVVTSTSLDLSDYINSSPTPCGLSFPFMGCY